MKIHLVAFANTSYSKLDFYSTTVDRLISSAIKFGVNSYHLYDEHSLPIAAHVKQHMENFHNIGYGYWGWKPIIILDLFKQIEKDDIVIYHDVGRPSYNYEFKKNINPLIQNVVNNYSGIGVAQGPWKNKHYCKKECFVNMECDSELFWEGNQAVATWNIWQNNYIVKNILQDWERYCFDPYGSITNENNMSDFNEYVGHRHDQAILTNILLKYHSKNSDIKFLEFRCGWEKDINNYIED